VKNNFINEDCPGKQTEPRYINGFRAKYRENDALSNDIDFHKNMFLFSGARGL
jgi:hypothetical protein